MSLSSGWLRIGTALVGIPILVGSLWLGGWVFALTFAGIAVLAQVELYRLVRASGNPSGGPLALIAGAAIVLAPLDARFVGVAIVALLVALGLLTFRTRGYALVGGAAATTFGIVYPPVLLAALVALRVRPDGFTLALLTLVLVWSADSAAYFVGRLLGKHKLAPSISPGKTWEGVAGGVAGAALAAAGFAFWSGLDWGWIHWVVVAVIAATAGPVGDLFESALKRSVDIKDSASLLPGHGGFLDRFDALAFVAPLIYLYVALTAL